VDHLHVGLKLATEARRHTDGVQPGDSVRAISNGDPTHVHLLAGHRRAALVTPVLPFPDTV
jgi:hypothetical protein